MGSRPHEFRVYWPHAGRVELAADFLARPAPMTSDGEGWWSIAVPLPERECRYCFMIDGTQRIPDYSAGEPQYDPQGQLVTVLSGATGGAANLARIGRTPNSAPKQRRSSGPITGSRDARRPQAG